VVRFSSDGKIMLGLCTFGFVNDVMFSHANGANRAESKTTRLFRRVRRGGTGTRGEVCYLRLHLVIQAKISEQLLSCKIPNT